MFNRAALLSAIMLLGALLGATPATAGAAPPPPPEAFAPSSAQLEFGDVDLHFGSSPNQSVQFSNGTQLPVPVFSATIAGPNASSFQIAGDGCSGQLVQATQSCSVEVGFQAQRGPQSATLQLFTGEGPVEVALSGSGITGTLSANPNPVHFSPIPFTPPGSFEGEYNENEQVNINNSQDAGTQIESVSITGPDASSFSIQYGNCEHNLLAPNKWCDDSVRFAPSSPGLKHASLVLEGDSSTPLVVPLEGQALNGPQVNVDSTQALLGDVAIGSSTQHTVAVSNSGDYPLVIQQAFRISGTPLMFPILSDTCSRLMLKPGASCTLTVGFTPTTLGEKDASILFITNASPITVIGIDGVGVRPVEALASSPSLSSPAAAQTGEAPAAGESPAATSSSNGEGSGAGGAPVQALAVAKLPRLLGAAGRAALDTGLLAQCPPQLQGCKALSVVTGSVPLHSSRAPSRHGRSTPVLLGSVSSTLRAGQSARLRVPLNRRGLALLAHRGHLRVTIKTVVRAGGKVVGERTQAVRLVAPGMASRSA
jgi:hypothetical protein